MGDEQQPTAGLKGKVARGLGWVGATQVIGQLIRTGGAIVIARLLVPEDYGLATLALVFTSLVLVFSDLALGAALVQRKVLTEDDRSTAFWMTIFCGVLFTVVGVGIAGVVSEIYEQPDVRPLLMVLSASFLITALGATQQSLLLREMHFKRMETLILAGTLAGTVAAVVVAAQGGGAWAIIAQQLVTAAVISLLMWLASDWRPRLSFSRASARSLWGFSGPLVGHRLLFYVHQNADNLIIGRVLGTAALGAYAVAYNVMLAPASRIAAPVQRVLAPAFSRLQDEPARMADAWARATRLVGMIVIPGMVGIGVVAPDFVPVVLGEQWAAAIPIVPVLAWVGMIQALQALNVDILMARGRTKAMFRYMCGFTAAHLIAFAIGVNWGIAGVAVAYAVSSTLVEPVLTVMSARAIGVSPFVFVRAISTVAESAFVMGAALLAARPVLIELGVPAGARLALLVVLGAAIYIPLALWRTPEILSDVKSLLGRGQPAAPAAAVAPAAPAAPVAA
jgi:O-antigen/teichoic acid export membrane protein